MPTHKTFQVKAKLLRNQRVAEKHYKMTLASSRLAKQAKPGQFVEVKVSEGPEPLLRRPFGVHRVSGSNFEILYEIVGIGTQLLSQKKPGASLDIIGPLGNGFTLSTTHHTAHILVAGGMGVAPLLFLAEKLKKQKPLVLIGAKTKRHILREKEFKQLGCSVKISTDDGSAGFPGKVTELLQDILQGHSPWKDNPCALYACGPRPMLKEIALIAKSHKIPAQISLEAHLACGIGACLGCVVNTKQGYKRVCKEGPVFEAQEIIW
ncbi:MAG: dihydroorotate dehydrogenase electron transfer subunit [Candidatus Omnitrophica bacterium]|nr:dihydroorotate dehydrogenase electron transfer subunit [Candidatus Omnitrophota bacterium]